MPDCLLNRVRTDLLSAHAQPGIAMYLHSTIPGFQAAVHQAADRALRGQPVAVAVDAAPQAPLFAVSTEARRHGLWPGWRAGRAKQRCPQLRICLPDPDLYERARQALVRLWAHYSPQVGGQHGHCDIDLHGTEHYWSRFLDRRERITEADVQARLIAQRGQAYCARRLHLPCYVGIAHSLLVARLAARVARDQKACVLDACPERCHSPQAIQQAEQAFIADLPLQWLPQLTPSERQQLRDCGLRSIGELNILAERGDGELAALLGAKGKLLAAALQGQDGEVVPTVASPEARISRQYPPLDKKDKCKKLDRLSNRQSGQGLDPLSAQRQLQALARELGFALRAQGLACTRLELELRWLDGRTRPALRQLPLACQHDDELEREAQALWHKTSTRRVHLERLRLNGLGLCPAEEQAVLFEPARRRRLQNIRDRLRQRFGDEIVSSANLTANLSADNSQT